MTRPDPSLHNQAGWRSFLRIGGPVLFAIGLALTAGGMVSFFSAFASFGMPTHFWLAFVGMPLMGLGIAMMRAGFLGPASRYVAGELTPTLRDTIGALGLGGGGELVCPACGGRNARDARYCDDCGSPMATTCPSCGATNAADARFCDDCGTEIARSA